jgi:hypothetical protein
MIEPTDERYLDPPDEDDSLSFLQKVSRALQMQADEVPCTQCGCPTRMGAAHHGLCQMCWALFSNVNDRIYWRMHDSGNTRATEAMRRHIDGDPPKKTS